MSNKGWRPTLNAFYAFRVGTRESHQCVALNDFTTPSRFE